MEIGVGPIAGLEDVEKRHFLNLPGLEPRLLYRPARSQSLYRLRYPDYIILHCSTLLQWLRMSFAEAVLKLQFLFVFIGYVETPF
jgi:hypothetical protein